MEQAADPSLGASLCLPREVLFTETRPKQDSCYLALTDLPLALHAPWETHLSCSLLSLTPTLQPCNETPRASVISRLSAAFTDEDYSSEGGVQLKLACGSRVLKSPWLALHEQLLGQRHVGQEADSPARIRVPTPTRQPLGTPSHPQPNLPQLEKRHSLATAGLQPCPACSPATPDP